MDITSEIKKEYNNPENWFEQIINVLASFAWAVGLWVAVSVIIINALLLVAFMASDPQHITEVDVAEFESTLEIFIALSSIIGAFIVVVFGLPRKLRNVFREYAESNIEHCEEYKTKLRSEINTTESLLKQYGLISKDDIEKRHAQLSGERLL